jgi:predicted kinase
MMRSPIVNRDAIRKTIGGSIRYFKEENRVTEIERLMVESLINAGHSEVVIDACHLKLTYRNAWQKFADHRDYEMHVYNVMTSLETCVSRAIRNFPDNPGFPEVIRNMWKKSAMTIGAIPEKQSDNWN